MNDLSLDCDVEAVQRAVVRMADQLAWLSYGEVRAEVNDPRTAVGKAIRSPCSMSSLTVLDRFVRTVAARIAVSAERCDAAFRREPYDAAALRGMRESRAAAFVVQGAWNELRRAVR